MKIDIIKNLQDFLNHTCAETPHQAGRNLYKSTDCGPWTAFIVEDEPARTATVNLTVRLKNGKLFASCEESLFDYENDLGPKVLRTFGFNPDGTLRLPGTHSVKAYRAKAEAFVAKHTANVNGFDRSEKYVVHPQQTGDLGSKRPPVAVNITATINLPAETRDVYYESKEANHPIPNCIGVKVGSIVEGSDVEIGPVELLFPFSPEDFDKAVQGVNDEADFYWKRDNLDSYHLETPGGDYHFDYGWGEPSDEQLPAALKPAVLAAIEKHRPEEGDTVEIEGVGTLHRFDNSGLIY